MAATSLTLSITATRTATPSLVFPIIKSYSINEPVVSETVVAHGTTAISLGGIATGRILIVSTTGPVTLTINSGPTIAITSLYIVGDSVTSLSATNSGTDPVVVTLLAAE